MKKKKLDEKFYMSARAAVILSNNAFFTPLTGTPRAEHISFSAGIVKDFICNLKIFKVENDRGIEQLMVG